MGSRCTTVCGGDRFEEDLMIDAHLHVWPDEWPEDELDSVLPPKDLRKIASSQAMVSAAAGVVGGALIVAHNFAWTPKVQLSVPSIDSAATITPTTYDHSYIINALMIYPNFYRGMCLADPSLDQAAAVSVLDWHHKQGFVGVRFNPYTFADNNMNSEVARALFAHAGELGMPVGFMCFKGLQLHLDDIEGLMISSPKTTVILDHFGFFRQSPTPGGVNDEAAWSKLLTLKKYPQLHVKLSAFHRVSAGPWPFTDLAPRVQQLVQAFSSKRLLWGSDFPYVMPPADFDYSKVAKSIASWGQALVLSEEEIADITRGNAKRLFWK